MVQGQERVVDNEDAGAQVAELSRLAREGRVAESLGPLLDREAWAKAAPVVQDLVIGIVAQRLGEAYRHLHTQDWERGGAAHRIASFEHIESGLRLNLLPGGRSIMGSPEDDELGISDERPLHEVRVKPTLAGVTLVTQRQWDRIGGRDSRIQVGDALPIERCSWLDVQDWLGRAGGELRLPSESEWEFACRAGTRTRWCFGDRIEELEDYAWHIGNSGRLQAVCEKLPNAFGLYDMHGNAFEWCQDDHGRGYSEDGWDERPWSQGSFTSRRRRGGSADTTLMTSRSAYRSGAEEAGQYLCHGFRAFRSIL